MPNPKPTDKATALQPYAGVPVRTVRLDSMVMSDPFIYPDTRTHTYYMTGTGGAVWRSKDLKMWEGPYNVLAIDSTSWTGAHPQVWAAEIHLFRGKFYYFATFTNDAITIDVVNGRKIPRRASQIFVSNTIEGPYHTVAPKPLLPAAEATLDGTFCIDELGHPYIVFCHEWIQNGNGTVEVARLTDDMDEIMGDPYVMFRASDCKWSAGKDSKGRKSFSPVTDGPFLFNTGTDRLGVIWSTWIDDKYTLAVAYSETGTLDGPWTQDARPLLNNDSGHAMIFKSFDGQQLMSLHRQVMQDGHQVRRPYLLHVDTSGDYLSIGNEYKP